MLVGVGVRARPTLQSCGQSQGSDTKSQSLGVLYPIAPFAQVTVVGCLPESMLQCRCTNLLPSSMHGCVSRMFLHACTCLPVLRRKASTGSDTACSAHQLRLHDCDVKPNAVKAVTALHPKMSAHVHMVSRPNKPKQTNQTAGQVQ